VSENGFFNTLTVFSDVGVDQNNNTIVVREDQQYLGNGHFKPGIFAQRCSHDDTPLSGRVNIAIPTSVFDGMTYPSVASDKYGNFVVTYLRNRKIAEADEENPEVWGYSLRVKAFDANFNQILAEQVVYSTTALNQFVGTHYGPISFNTASVPQIAMTDELVNAGSEDGFVIAWDMEPLYLEAVTE
jgi:hypothetical protein